MASCSWTRYDCNLTAKPSGYFCSVGDGVQTIGRRISTFLWLQQWYKHVQAFLAQFTENNCVALQAGVKQLPRADCLATTSVLLSAFKLWQVGKPCPLLSTMAAMARGSSPVHGSRASSSRCIGAGKPFVKLSFAGSPMRCALGGDGLKKTSVKDRELPHGSAYSDKGSIHWKCTGQITWLLLVQTTLSNKTSQSWVRFVIGMERLRHLRRLQYMITSGANHFVKLLVIGMERLRQLCQIRLRKIGYCLLLGWRDWDKSGNPTYVAKAFPHWSAATRSLLKPDA